MSETPEIILERKKEFARQYVSLNNGAAAYRIAYPNERAKLDAQRSAATRLLADPEIQRLITERREALSVQFNVTVAMVLKKWWEIADADPNKLIKHRNVACRHCHGFHHLFQWVTMEEWATASAAAISEERKSPSADGGIGFNSIAAPHPKCPFCHGEGLSNVFVADTEKVASPLYAGLKQTRDGIQILMRDQDKALDNIARYLGMFHDRQPGAANGNPIVPALSVTVKTAAEASKLYKQFMG